MASSTVARIKKWFARIERKDHEEQDKYTSIESIFQFELLSVRLCAGFMFGGNKYLCLLYRALIMIWAKYTQVSFQTSFQNSLYKSLSAPVLANLKFFILFYVGANVLATLTTLMSSLFYHKCLCIPLMKKFDRGYLMGPRLIATNAEHGDENGGQFFKFPLTSSASSANSTVSTASSSGIGSGGITSISGSLAGESEDGRGDCGSDKSLVKHAPTFGVKSGRSASLSLARTIKMIDSISKITVIKFLLVFYLSLNVMTAFYVNEHSKVIDCGLDKTMVLNETMASDLAALTQILRSIIDKRAVDEQEYFADRFNETLKTQILATTILEKNVTNATTTTTTTSRPASGNRTYVMPRRWRSRPADCARGARGNKRQMLKSVTSNTFYYAWTILRHVVNCIANFYQIYGHVVVTLMITAALTDILRRVNEQECVLTALQGLDHSGLQTYELFDEFSINREQQILSGIYLPTTDILIHTRDILCVLKVSLAFDYVAIQVYDVSQLIVLFGSILALVSSKSKLGWLIIFSIDYLQVNLSMMLTRITYHWLHAEARKIRHLSEQRVMSCNSRLNRSELDFNMHDSGQSCDGQEELAVHTCATKFEYYRITAIMHYRLAEQIEGLWPCDWFVPDLEACLSLNLFVITFVATLQQLVEASNQMGISRIFESRFV